MIAPQVNTQRSWQARLAMPASVAAVALLGAFAVLAFVHFREQKTGRDVVQFEFTIPEKVMSARNHLAVSPDGKRVVFTALGADGVPRLWIHSFDSLADSSPLIGTEGVVLNGYPFWSWDSRFVVFQTGGFGSAGKLKKVEVSGGPPQTICDPAADFMMSGFWSRKGQIVFGTAETGLLQVPATGGAPSPITTLDAARQERGHAFPVLLPDERRFLYRISSAKSEYAGIYVGLLNDASPASRGKRLLLDEAEIAFARSLEPGASKNEGDVLFVRASTLMAQRFDAARGELSGEPTPIAQSIASVGAFGVSDNGVLVYRAGRQDRELTWFNRRGNVLAAAAPPAPYNFLALSPDDTRAAVQRLETFRVGDLWILDLTRGRCVQLLDRTTLQMFLAPRRIAFAPSGQRMKVTFCSGDKCNTVPSWICSADPTL